MIRKLTMYQAVCDRCGSIFMNGKSGSPIAFEDEEWLRAYCSERDWQEIDGKLYCPNCVEYDEETDEYKPKSKEE